tara:strand:- start:544 stop:960 length:417 start_codon:yes stop_codon:yes gene_type:complete
MAIPIKHLHKKYQRPTQQVIEHIAREVGVTEQTAYAMILSFHEAVADQLTRGNVVRFPGFGAYAVVPLKFANVKAGIRLLPSTALKSQVFAGDPPLFHGARAKQNYRTNHYRTDAPCRTFEVMQNLRKQLTVEKVRRA